MKVKKQQLCQLRILHLNSNENIFQEWRRNKDFLKQTKTERINGKINTKRKMIKEVLQVEVICYPTESSSTQRNNVYWKYIKHG